MIAEHYDKEIFLGKMSKLNRLSLIPHFTRVKRDNKYKQFADRTLDAVFAYAKANGDSMDYIVKAYNDYYFEYIDLQNEFNNNGKYRYGSYEELSKALSPTFQKNYIYVLLLSFLTTTYRYEMMAHISESLQNLLAEKSEIGLEIGFGTGIDLVERLHYCESYDIFEINKYSREMFDLLFADNKTIAFNNVLYTFDDVDKYTFVQLIELMEHLEDPKKYIDLTHKILKKNGCLVFTAAVNMANIDHIYLFNNLQSVRDLIDKEKWEIVDEKCFINSLIKYPEEKINEIINSNKSPYITTHILRKL
jgi:SAM-dependent methyltransferase